jgi:hypothetical protein
MGKLIQVAVNRLNGVDLSPSQTKWVESDKIDDLMVVNGNGSAFKYTPSYAAGAQEYITDTAASDIAADTYEA